MSRRATVVLVDDHLLLRVLLDREPSGLRPRSARLATTGLWYHRLCRALADPTVAGVLSRSLGGVDDTTAAAALRSVLELPDTIELVSMRTLAWPMAELLRAGVQGNLLTLEALAAAQALGARLCLAEADANPSLLRAADVLGIDARLVA